MQTLSRRKVAAYVAGGLAEGKPADRLLQQAAAYLVESKKVADVELLIRDIELLLASKHKVVLAEVISARELSAGLIKNIEQFIASSEGAVQVEVNTSIDPSLLGGVIIRTPRAELDSSVRKQLNALKS